MAVRARLSFVITERRELHDHVDPCPFTPKSVASWRIVKFVRQ